MTILEVNQRLWGASDIAFGVGSYWYTIDGLSESVPRVNASFIPSEADPTRDVESLFALVDLLESQVTTIINTFFYLFITPDQFGAVGDGNTDDTVAVNNWLISITANSKIGFVPPKTYLCSNILYGENLAGLSKAPPEVFGCGSSSVFKCKLATTGTFFKALNFYEGTLRDFTIDANDVDGVTVAFDTSYNVGGNSHCTFERLAVINYKHQAWKADNNADCINTLCAVGFPSVDATQLAFSSACTNGSMILYKFYCDGYIDISADSLTLDACTIVGLLTTAKTNLLLSSSVYSNPGLDSVISATCDTFVMIGGQCNTTLPVTKHLTGTYKTGAKFVGTKFDGIDIARNILGAGLVGDVGIPTFTFENCFVGNAVLNYSPCPVGIYVVAKCVNLNSVSLLNFPDFNLIRTVHTTPGPFTWYNTNGSKTLYIQAWSPPGSGGGANGTYDGGDGGPGLYGEKYVDVRTVVSTDCNIGTALAGGSGALALFSGSDGQTGGTTYFGSYISLTGGSPGQGGQIGATGAAGVQGVATGADYSTVFDIMFNSIVPNIGTGGSAALGTGQSGYVNGMMIIWEYT